MLLSEILKDSKFEKIRNEAIENDGEYEVQSR